MDAPFNLTPQSLIYRQRAAELGRESERTTDLSEQLVLVKRALEWIQLAENEELLSQHLNRPS